MNPLLNPQAPQGHTALSVNVNKIALLRNTRHLEIPNVVGLSRALLQAGADGITVHPRPDERHIRPADVRALAALLKEWPQAEYNIEGNPFHNLMPFVRELRPQQTTFVPDSTDQFTSDHGWRFPDDLERLMPLVAECRALGVRVSLFMDPLPEQMALAAATGADRIELYTESYAHAHAQGGTIRSGSLGRYAAAARAASAAGLGINAGHDLNRDNLADFLREVPAVQEVSIGHAFVADMLELGLRQTVRDYQACIRRAQAPASA